MNQSTKKSNINENLTEATKKQAITGPGYDDSVTGTISLPDEAALDAIE